MSNVHVYAVAGQPLTDYVDEVGEQRFRFRNKPLSRFRCATCGRVRAAKNLSIQVYYDGCRIFCTNGHKHDLGDRRRKLVPA